MTVKLHVGGVYRTRTSGPIEVLKSECDAFYCSDGVWRSKDGWVLDDLMEFVAPWEEPAAKVGECIGWNGGECPVHPETVVEVQWPLNKETHKTIGEHMTWQDTCLYRIITPYDEPKKAREFWVAVRDGDAIDITSHLSAFDGYDYTDIIKVREVLDDE